MNEFLYGVTVTTGGQQSVTAALIAIATTPTTDLVEYGIQSAAVLLAAVPTLLVYCFGGGRLGREHQRVTLLPAHLGAVPRPCSRRRRA